MDGDTLNLGQSSGPGHWVPNNKQLPNLGVSPELTGLLLVTGPKGHIGDRSQLDPREPFTEAV